MTALDLFRDKWSRGFKKHKKEISNNGNSRFVKRIYQAWFYVADIDKINKTMTIIKLQIRLGLL